ncbi:hypothetical protein [Brochothrix campestris]|uniref:Uncharacterized protein n=1 Tax=Brochothrix campestris FSL F6-1037 TaxID=1265861 RepID=W7CRC8_9LIST|nr:hypothetical protein [Brochothrix campestris]EUJ39632.1 hypothetical protein BCAMP_06847 [Brochothrix campestris FSL F6-1037]
MKALLITFLIGVFFFGVLTGIPVGSVLLYGILLLIAVIVFKGMLFKNMVKKDAEFDSRYSKHYRKYRNKFDR